MAKRKRRARRRLPRVLLLVETTYAKGIDILIGVNRYIEEHRPWSIYFQERAVTSAFPKWTWTWEGDGIISRSATYDADKAPHAHALSGAAGRLNGRLHAGVP